MPKKIFAVILGLILTAGYSVADARPDEYTGDVFDVPPAVYMTEVSLNTQNFSPGQKVMGEITLQSNEAYVLSGFKLGFDLKQTIKDENPEQGKVINTSYSNESLIIKPNSSQKIPFSYEMPKVLPDGNYHLMVSLRNPESAPVAWKTKALGYVGSEKAMNFVTLNDAFLQTSDSSQWDLNIGMVQRQGINVTLKGKGVLQGDMDSVTVFPKVIVYERAVGEKIVFEESSTQGVVFKKGEAVPFEVKLPKLDIPGGYFAEVYFEKNFEVVSNIVIPHWVVEGESGRIISASLNKTSFEAEEVAVVDVQLADRADLHFATGGEDSSLGEVELKGTLICDGNSVGTVSKIVNLRDATKTTLEIPVNKKASGCSVSLEMQKDGQILHTKTLDYDDNTDKNMSDTLMSSGITSMIVILAGIVLVILLALVMYKLRVNSKKMSLWLIPLALVGFGMHVATALAGPCTAISINVNSPIPEPKLYEYGEQILLDGSAHVTYCTNLPSDLRLKFFVDEETQPFYEKNYYQPDYFGYTATTEQSTVYFNGKVPGPLSPGEHKVRVEWFQDCTRQNEGTANGTITRYFRVKSPESTLKVTGRQSINVGQTAQYRAYYDSDGIGPDPEVEITSNVGVVWSSSNPQFATSEGNGLFKGVHKGSTKVSVTFLTKTAEADLEINDQYDAYLELIPDKNTILVREKVNVKAIRHVYESGAWTTQEVSFPIFWSTSDITILRNTGSGEFEGAGEGLATVMAFYSYKGKWLVGSTDIRVFASTLKIQPSDVVASLGAEIQYRSYYDSDGVNGPVAEQEVTNTTTWESSHPEISSLLAAGKYKAQKVGFSTIIGTYLGLTKNAMLQVTDIETPLRADLRIFPTTAYSGDLITAELLNTQGGVPPYKYELVSVGYDGALTETNQPITSLYGIKQDSPIFKFKYPAGTSAPSKFMIELKITDAKTGNFANLRKEITFFGEKKVQEVSP
jgi:hypothetical protein